MKLNVSTKGLNEVKEEFSLRGVKAQVNADKITEKYTRKMANESASMAPVRDNILRPDIVASPRRIKLGTWEYGSTLPYARRQEYENPTKKGFIRKAVWNNRDPYREALRKELAKK